ncbi:MAG: hypothetical protein IJ875_06795, partial [Solobacterium sp.]|nr:hypothetical protein [Solobacterium sp.]
ENNIKAATVQGSHNAMVSDALTTALFNCKDDTERISLIQKIEKEYQLDLAYSWFIQTGNEKGKLMVSEDFHKQIIEESISDHVEKVEVIK